MISRKFAYTIIALLTLGITGCSQDDDLTPSVDGKQELSIATRSTDGAGNTTATFTRPFVLELWAGNRKETFQMTYTEGSGWNTVKSSFSLPILVLAYCGEDVYSTSHDSYTVAVKVDQTDSDKLMAADVMVATGEAFAGVPLELNFRHYFSKVTFNVTYDGFANVPTLSEIKLGDISYFLNSDNKIEMIKTPGHYIAGMEILSLKVNGVTQSVTLKNNTILEAGKHYTYNLTIGTKEATLTATNGYPGGWNDSETELN